jgi:hypothetical protein
MRGIESEPFVPSFCASLSGRIRFDFGRFPGAAPQAFTLRAVGPAILLTEGKKSKDHAFPLAQTAPPGFLVR